jgi:hypothetical protein
LHLESDSIQEIVHNAEIVLICGKVELSWFRTITALRTIKNGNSSKRIFEAHTVNALQKTADLWSSNNSWRDLQPPSAPNNEHILDLVSEFCRYGCTDARDRIFAVHALSNGNDAKIRIDYGQNVYTTYRRFALACMAARKTPAILTAALARLDLTTTTTHWPSWIPDWRRKPARYDGDLPSIGMCAFTGKIHNNIATIKFQCLYPHTSPPLLISDQQSLIVIQDSITSMKQSVFDFLIAVNVLYVGSNSMRDHPFFGDILQFLQSTGYFSFDATQWDLLIEYVSKMETEGEEEAKVAESVAHVMKGSCFFKVEFPGSGRTYFCYGSSTIRGGDILMPMECCIRNNSPVYHRAYKMCAIRSIEGVCEGDATTTLKDCWTQKLYHMVGETWLAFPLRPEGEILTSDMTRPVVELQLC